MDSALTRFNKEGVLFTNPNSFETNAWAERQGRFAVQAEPIRGFRSPNSFLRVGRTLDRALTNLNKAGNPLTSPNSIGSNVWAERSFRLDLMEASKFKV